jgi:ectoine hydroxylase-related dioxygenase (phytanoyl-CoA dioxygenase family)
MLAAVVYLEDSSVESGCLCVIPGVHRQGAIDHQHDGSYYLEPEKYPLDQATPCEGKAGDVLIFSYLTPHGSYPNRTKNPRRIVLFQFRSADDLPLKGVHQSPGQGMMIAGINPIPTAKQI